MLDIIGNSFGMVWMVLLLLGYYLVQNEKVKPKNLKFILLNIGGGLCMLVSLSINFNLASFLLECIFTSIGLKALFDHYTKNKKR